MAARIRVTTQFLPVYPAYLDKAPTSIRLPSKPPPALPFNKDKAHTTPTRWGLYRALLRYAGRRTPIETSGSGEDGAGPSGTRLHSSSDLDVDANGKGKQKESSIDGEEGIRWPGIYEMVRADWRDHSNRYNLSMTPVRQFLSYYYGILGLLEDVSALTYPSSSSSSSSSSPSSPRPSANDSLERLMEIEREALETLAQHQIDMEQERIRKAKEKLARVNRPYRLTGGFLWPSHFLPPLPRMRPQPLKISAMYRARLRRRGVRILTVRDAEDSLADVKEERKFLDRLGLLKDQEDLWKLGGPGGWATLVNELTRESLKHRDKEEARAKMLFTPKQFEVVMRARKRRHKVYMSYAWQRRLRMRQTALADRQRTANFLSNRQKQDELRVERWKRMSEDEMRPVPAGRNMKSEVVWAEDEGFTRHRRMNRSGRSYGIKREALKGLVEKSREDIKNRRALALEKRKDAQERVDGVVRPGADGQGEDGAARIRGTEAQAPLMDFRAFLRQQQQQERRSRGGAEDEAAKPP